jgi:hypothetical protein
MQFGKRNIRSAGRNSGSVEITLPVDLAVLEGVACQLVLRDGLMPEIVLHPDLRDVVPVFEAFWDRLGLGLEGIGAVGDFSEADYALALFPTVKWGPRPPLAYADGLLIRRCMTGLRGIDAQALECFARIVESLAAVAGRRLTLSDELAASFGNQVADVLSGGAIDRRDAFIRGFAAQMAARRTGEDLRKSLFDEAPWRAAQPDLTRLFEQFASWMGSPETLAKAREHWYRARRFEAHVATTRKTAQAETTAPARST